MTAEEYFGMIVFILMGLTFIALFLIFLYMVYGEKEEESSSSKLALSILRFIFSVQPSL